MHNVSDGSATLTYYGTTDKKVSTIASFEMVGFVYTEENVAGYRMQKVNMTLNTFDGSANQFLTSKTWKIMQADQGNHMHRPVFGTPSDEWHKIYRITSNANLWVNDTDVQTDFYNFDVQFGRYRAITLQPGNLTQAPTGFDYNKMKITVVDLRQKNVEQKIVVSRPGCGDGMYNAGTGYEQCDDGNTINGDGCDQNCQIEEFTNCTQVDGQLSVCTKYTCGNGLLDFGEECDDENWIDGDGCSSCTIDLGYYCTNTTCSPLCGDGLVSTQYEWNSTANASTATVRGQEECDLGNSTFNLTDSLGNRLGCFANCTVVPGWECAAIAGATGNYSSCKQTCGDGVLNSTLGEVCDTGNALYSTIIKYIGQSTVSRTENANYNTSLASAGYQGCESDCKNVTSGYRCPLSASGLCMGSCGDGVYEGVFVEIGRNVSQVLPAETCDDGNDVDGDGCSRMCQLEDPTGLMTGEQWRCTHNFLRLEYELPLVKTSCALCSGSGCLNTNATNATSIVVNDPSVNNTASSSSNSTGTYLDLSATVTRTRYDSLTTSTTATNAGTTLWVFLDYSGSMVGQKWTDLVESTTQIAASIFPASPMFEQTLVGMFADDLFTLSVSTQTEWDTFIASYAPDRGLTYISKCFNYIQANINSTM